MFCLLLNIYLINLKVQIQLNLSVYCTKYQQINKEAKCVSRNLINLRVNKLKLLE